MTGSNRRHSACKADALPAELITLRFGVARILRSDQKAGKHFLK
jgi:hypothetical protein